MSTERFDFFGRTDKELEREEIEKNKQKDNIEDTVECRSKVPSVRIELGHYTGLLDGLMQQCVKGKETITFSLEDWKNTLAIIRQVEEKVQEMSSLTPVTQAHGLCKATVCQWDALSKVRDTASKDKTKLKTLYRITEFTLGLMDKLVAEKVVSLDEWWTVKVGQIRSEIDEMKKEFYE